jgi:hypothetical protein
MGDQSSSRKEFVARIGTFFVLLGIGMLVFYGLSESANAPMLQYFCWGALLLTLGLFMQGQFKRAPGPPSGRFSIFQRLKRKPKEEKKK